MSKPDRQLTLVEAFRYFKSGELSEREAEAEVKSLMLELIGEDEHKSSKWDSLLPEKAVKDDLRAELRDKIKAL